MDKKTIYIIATGMNGYDTMTKQALDKVRECELLIGAKRMVALFSDWEKECKILEEYINKRRSNLLSSVKSYFNLSDEEMKKYFG